MCLLVVFSWYQVYTRMYVLFAFPHFPFGPPFSFSSPLGHGVRERGGEHSGMDTTIAESNTDMTDSVTRFRVECGSDAVDAA